MNISISAGRGARISPKLYGIFLEDINYGCDGGLYAELVANRAFENEGPDGADHRMMAWTASCPAEIRTENPRGEKNLHYLHLSGGAWTLRNAGYLGQGMHAAAGADYRLTVIARGSGTVQARLVTADGAVLACTDLTLEAAFAKQTVTLTAATAGQAWLELSGSGEADFDFVSLFPADTFLGRENGCRKDLAQALADLKPAFLRFPGGCIVEGRSFANMYRFRETLGPVEERRTNWNRWQLDEYQKDGNHSEDYFQTYGMGFYEFFQFCEDIGARPLPILNCGLTCQWHEGLAVPMDEMDGVIQDYFDLIEFCNGGTDTPMGRIRAEMGHPAPFKLEMIGVGNEQWNPVYFERYEVIHRAVKAQYPEIELIGCAGWTDHGAEFDAAMDWMRRTPTKPDFSDEHYYKQIDWFFRNVNRYADYDAAHLPLVFAGEYAAHAPDGRNTLHAALAEAAFLTGVENASPHVAMACYAPLFGRIGGYQWKPDMIWFDQERCYPTVNYYVQQLFSLYRGDWLAPVTVDGANPEQPLYITASWREADGALVVKAVNPHAQAQTARFCLPEGLRTAEMHVLQGEDLLADNAPGNTPIRPVRSEAAVQDGALSLTLPLQSVTVLVIR
jgi:alpha-N-arabinofuranosidase